MNCPHCGKEIIITLNRTKDKTMLAWKIHAQALRDEWERMGRAAHNDDRNLDWLDGRMTLLKEIGISKYEALRLLKQEDDV